MRVFENCTSEVTLSFLKSAQIKIIMNYLFLKNA